MKSIRYACLRILFLGRRAARPAGGRRVPVDPIGGFTLIEVMTVVSIIAVLAGIGIYSINTNMDRIKADTAARRTALALNYARIRAVAENCNYVVTFRTRNNAGTSRSESYIEMLADVDMDGVKDAKEKIRIEDLPNGIIYDLDGIVDIDNVLAGSDSRDGIAFSDNKVTFMPRGNADKAGVVYFIPEKSLEKGLNDNRRAVSVERLTGKTIGWFYRSASAGKNPWKEEGK